MDWSCLFPIVTRMIRKYPQPRRLTPQGAQEVVHLEKQRKSSGQPKIILSPEDWEGRKPFLWQGAGVFTVIRRLASDHGVPQPSQRGEQKHVSQAMWTRVATAKGVTQSPAWERKVLVRRLRWPMWLKSNLLGVKRKVEKLHQDTPQT